MTSYTKTVLESQFLQAELDLHKAKLAIGAAAGPENDWHDNAAFDQANIDYDVRAIILANLKRRLKNVVIITPRSQTDQVKVGNTLMVKFENEEEEETFTILGPEDSGKKQGWLSYASPFGNSLLGKKEGEVAEFLSGQGELFKVRVIKILPGEFE